MGDLLHYGDDLTAEIMRSVMRANRAFNKVNAEYNRGIHTVFVPDDEWGELMARYRPHDAPAFWEMTICGATVRPLNPRLR
jgi:hypothetical protein